MPLSQSVGDLAHETGELAGRDGKTLVRTMVDDALADAAAVDAAVDARGLRLARGQDAEDVVRAIIATVFANNPVQVEQVRSGKDKVKGFLVGQVLKAAGKGVDPKLAQRLVDDALAGS